MKNILILLLALFCTSNIWALNYASGLYGEKDPVKYSTTKWTITDEYETSPLPGKPGRNDTLRVRRGGNSIDIDANIEIKELSIGEGSELTAKGRIIKVRRQFVIAYPGGNGLSEIILSDGTNVDVSGIFLVRHWERTKSLSNVRVVVDESNLIVQGSMVVQLNSVFVKNSEQGLFEMDLKGKSSFKAADFYLDPEYIQRSDEFLFRFKFSPKKGVMPTMEFKDESTFKGIELSVNIDDSLKKGSYPLMILESKKSNIDGAKFVVNGRSTSLGTPIKFGKGKTAKLQKLPAGKDKQTANDFVLVVE